MSEAFNRLTMPVPVQATEEHLAKRQEKLARMKQNTDFKTQWEGEGLKKHATAMHVRKQREQTELRFEMTMSEKKRRSQALVIKRVKDDMINGIVEFEKTLERMGKDSKSSSNAAPNAAASEPVEKHGIIFEGEMEAEEAKKVMMKDANLYVSKIKSKKMEETIARKDRDQRRRKIMIEQQRVFKDIEERRRNELLLQKLLRQSVAEQELAKKYVQ